MPFDYRLFAVAALLVGSAALAQATQPTTTPTTAPATQSAAITWDHAAQHVGETVTVTGPVLSTYALEEGHLILNIGKDYPEPDRFSIFVTVPANARDADATYAGKTVTVTGKIEHERDVPEIRANAVDVSVQK